MDGQPDKEGVRALGICTCGCDTFRIKIYSCGWHRDHCVRCNKAWSAFSEGQAQDPGSTEAVGEGRDEP